MEKRLRRLERVNQFWLCLFVVVAGVYVFAGWRAGPVDLVGKSLRIVDSSGRVRCEIETKGAVCTLELDDLHGKKQIELVASDSGASADGFSRFVPAPVGTAAAIYVGGVTGKRSITAPWGYGVWEGEKALWKSGP